MLDLRVPFRNLHDLQDGWEQIKNEGIKANGFLLAQVSEAVPGHLTKVLEEFLDTGHIRSTAGPLKRMPSTCRD